MQTAMGVATEERQTSNQVCVQDSVQLSASGFKHVGCVQRLRQVLGLDTDADEHVVGPSICVLPWQDLKQSTRSFAC